MRDPPVVPETGPVVSLDLALELRAAGLSWKPSAGDRFVVLQPDLLDQPFVLSDMTVDVHDFPDGRVIGFNGTVEWALDSVELDKTVWLPHEHQLRDRVEPWLRRLERTSEGYRVVLAMGEEVAVEATDAAEAYGRALLLLLE